MTPEQINRAIAAAEQMDWMQVTLNQGAPCFHLEKDGYFCGRAPRWDGHFSWRNSPAAHKFVSLANLLRTLGEWKEDKP